MSLWRCVHLCLLQPSFKGITLINHHSRKKALRNNLLWRIWNIKLLQERISVKPLIWKITQCDFNIKQLIKWLILYSKWPNIFLSYTLMHVGSAKLEQCYCISVNTLIAFMNKMCVFFFFQYCYVSKKIWMSVAS